MLSCNKNAHLRHFRVCVCAFLKCRLWGWLPCGSIFTPVVWRTLARSAIIVRCLWWLMKKMSFTVRISHCFPPHHQLLSCIIVHKSSFLPSCCPVGVFLESAIAWVAVTHILTLSSLLKQEWHLAQPHSCQSVEQHRPWLFCSFFSSWKDFKALR